MKRITAIFLAIILCVSLSACGDATVSQSSYDALKALNDNLQGQISELQIQISELQSQKDDLAQKLESTESEFAKLKDDLQSAIKENKELAEKIDDIKTPRLIQFNDLPVAYPQAG